MNIKSKLALAALAGVLATPVYAQIPTTSVNMCGPIGDSHMTRYVVNEITGNHYVLDSRGCAVMVLADQSYFSAHGFVPAEAQPTQDPQQINFNGTNLQHWRRAVSNVRRRESRAKLLIIGDSLTAGAGAGTDASLPGFFLDGSFFQSWPYYLSKLLNTYFVATSYNSFAGFGSIIGNTIYSKTDTRFTGPRGFPASPSEWTVGPGNHALGGLPMVFVPQIPMDLTFTPESSINTFIIYNMNSTSPAGGTFQAIVNGVTLATINTSATKMLVSSTLTMAAPASPATLVLEPDDIGYIFIPGIVAYDSTVPAIDIINGAAGGGGTIDFSDQGQTQPGPFGLLAGDPVEGAPAMIRELAPDLTIIALTNNDAGNRVPLANYRAQLQNIITNALRSGDVMLSTGIPQPLPAFTTPAGDPSVNGYIKVMKELAILNNLPMLDLHVRYPVIPSSVWPISGDLVHPDGRLYQDWAQAVFNVLAHP